MKRLPYFQFEPAEWTAKDIQFCSLASQGLFINICSLYWIRECRMTEKQLFRKFSQHESLIEELLEEEIFEIIEGEVVIDFLDNQMEAVLERSAINKANGSRGGRPKKNRKETETKPNVKQTETKTKGNKIKEDKIKEDKRKDIKERAKKFGDALKSFSSEYSDQLLNDFFLYWSEHGPNDKKMRFEKQTSFSIARRLAKWKSNAEKWAKENGKPDTGRRVKGDIENFEFG